MDDGQPDPTLWTRYRSWLAPSHNDAPPSTTRHFFEQSRVIPDANVLLDLYRYTKDGREQVLAAFELFSRRKRLWLPHQVGLEFSRNRAKAVQGRLTALSSAGKALDAKFRSAIRLIGEARDDVVELIRDMTQDDAVADSLGESIADDVIGGALGDWQTVLANSLKALRAAEAISPRSVVGNDPLLPRIGALFGDEIGDAPPESVVREWVETAVNYRYPNRIPPGFADAKKGTALAAAGDYIIWEQIIEFANTLPAPRRLIFVSGDTKGDWYEQDENGKAIRPWPALDHEMSTRAKAEILILTPRAFLRGAHDILGAPMQEETYDEVERVSQASKGSPLNENFNFTSPLGPVEQAHKLWAAFPSSEKPELTRLRYQLEQITREQEQLETRVAELESDPNYLADLADPRSYAKAIVSRAEALKTRADALRQRINTLGGSG
ncbi:hypothetical protein FHX75_1243 [Micromonospora palomenae]|uniref:PIN like domain-containing protein n=1 Tax=Micromonospora palomenae TaxID=1461247 RepID=A0A561WCD8_9ACTN|nr:PIN-like domain-containing protein [Micromonospora palomenae]TWG21530.1 hypothetical protein FHX75_1243 [Micromonospora palomenae]